MREAREEGVQDERRKVVRNRVMSVGLYVRK